jgi:hypothetical protein
MRSRQKKVRRSVCFLAGLRLHRVIVRHNNSSSAGSGRLLRGAWKSASDTDASFDRYVAQRNVAHERPRADVDIPAGLVREEATLHAVVAIVERIAERSPDALQHVANVAGLVTRWRGAGARRVAPRELSNGMYRRVAGTRCTTRVRRRRQSRLRLGPRPLEVADRSASYARGSFREPLRTAGLQPRALARRARVARDRATESNVRQQWCPIVRCIGSEWAYVLTLARAEAELVSVNLSVVPNEREEK